MIVSLVIGLALVWAFLNVQILTSLLASFSGMEQIYIVATIIVIVSWFITEKL